MRCAPLVYMCLLALSVSACAGAVVAEGEDVEVDLPPSYQPSPGGSRPPIDLSGGATGSAMGGASAGGSAPAPPPSMSVCQGNSEESSEPNNSPLEAFVLSPGEWAGGLCDQTSDYYRVPSSGAWVFNLVFDSSVQDLQLALLDESGQVLQQGVPEPSSLSLSGEGPALLRVSSATNQERLYRLVFREDMGAAQRPDEGDFQVSINASAYDQARQRADAIAPAIADEFLNALFALPQDIPISFEDCGFVNAYYSPDTQSVTMCYEIIREVSQVFRNYATNLTDEERSVVIDLTWQYILLHEVGHALVDVYDLPITGREEDTVDDFAAVMLYLGGVTDAIIYAAFFWYYTETEVSDTSLVDEHSLNGQRKYSLLCFVLGSDPGAYSDYILSVFPEMQDRAPRCVGEFEQKMSSWRFLLEQWLLVEL